MPNEIQAAALTSFDVDPDGACVRIHVRDRAGLPATLVLPLPCANQLLMTLPRMVQTALCNSHGDDSLRLVHPLTCYTLEAGEWLAGRGQQYILTIGTEGGFTASFAGSEDYLSALARSIFHDIPAYPLAASTAS